MGPVNSKNITENTINQFIEVINETIQNSSTSATLANLVHVTSGCTMNNVVIDQRIGFNITSSSMQDAKSDNDLEQKLKLVAEQQAKSISVNFSLNPASTKSENILRLCTSLGTTIKNAFQQNCSLDIFATNGISCSDDGSSITNTIVTQEIIGEALLECIQKSKAVNTAKQDLEEEISQSASSEQKDVIAGIILAAVLAMLVFMGAPVVLLSSGTGGILKMFLFFLLIALYLYFECKSGVFLLKKCCRWCKTDTIKNITWISYAVVVLITLYFKFRKLS